MSGSGETRSHNGRRGEETEEEILKRVGKAKKWKNTSEGAVH